MQWLRLLLLSRISRVQLFVIPWTVGCQAPLAMRFSRQEYWSRLPFPPPGYLPNPGSNPCLLYFLYWQEDSLPMGKLVKPVEPTSEFSCGWMRKLDSYLSFFEAYLCGVNVLIFLAPIRCNLSTLCCQHNHSGKQMLGAMVYKRAVSRSVLAWGKGRQIEHPQV